MWRDGLHTSVADKHPEESLVTQSDLCVLGVASLFVYCCQKADPIEKELATLVADLRSFSRNGVEVLSSPHDRFWSALGGNTIKGEGEVLQGAVVPAKGQRAASVRGDTAKGTCSAAYETLGAVFLS